MRDGVTLGSMKVAHQDALLRPETKTAQKIQ